MSCFKAILLISGDGERFKDPLPKQFHRLSGKPIYQYALDTLLANPNLKQVHLVCHPGWIEYAKKECQGYDPSRVCFCVGGKSRRESVYKGLLSIGSHCDYVLIHDGVRPFISSSLIEKHLKCVVEHKAVNTCIPCVDTINRTKDKAFVEDIPYRDEMLRGQTPQTFAYSVVKRAHEQIAEQTHDDCRLVLKSSHPVYIVDGEETNIKITTHLDLFHAEQILRTHALFIDTHESENSLHGKIFAITGGGGGIGRSITERILERGGMPISIGRQACDIDVDITKPGALKQAFMQLGKECGKIDGLINCAGLLKVTPLETLTDEEIEHLVTVNLTAMIYSCKYAPLTDVGHIINMSSSSYARGRKLYGVYSSTKAAVVNFTQALADERPHQKINVVVPSRTLTAMRTKNFPKENPSQLLDPKAVAQVVVDLLQRDDVSGNIVEVRKN